MSWERAGRAGCETGHAKRAAAAIDLEAAVAKRLKDGVADIHLEKRRMHPAIGSA
jgi:hypothetical protein